MRLRRHVVWLAATAIFLSAVLPASAGFDRIFRFCPEDFLILEPERERIWIPVGCEAVDCCPGCPGPPMIDWRIRYTGEMLERVSLRFEGMPPEAAGRLNIKGEARWQGDTLEVGKGETLISGFSPAGQAAPPVAVPRFAFSREAIRNIQAAADREAEMLSADAAQRGPQAEQAQQAEAPRADSEAARKDAPRFELIIEQLLGGVVVNEFRLHGFFRPCRRPRPSDKIDVNNNTTNDSTVTLLDARSGSGACLDDTVWRGNDIINVGSVRTNGSCNSEIAVFSDDNAMLMLTPVNSWTDPLGDTVPANLAALLQAPVDIWIMRGTFAATQARATTDMARANQLYNTMNCGISLTTGTVTDATADPDTAGLLDSDCGNAANLRNRIGFTNGRLNVYYLNDAGARGWWCGNNTIIVASSGDNETLSHEFGHSFTLDHTNGVDFNGDGVGDFGTNNVMWGGATGRNSFTEGQCFRCNMNTGSTLNGNGVRTGPTRSCPDSTISATCPWLALDATPN